MKKLTSIILLFSLSCIFSSCPGDTSSTYITIKTVHALLYSFDRNGVFPYLDNFDKNELGIGIYPDSVSKRVELAQSFSIGNRAYASDNPNEIIYTNSIESINIITLYNFDANHPAGSNINNILLHLNSMGITTEYDINKLSSTEHFFKFSTVPQNDSLQFEITGIITDEGEFITRTELVVLDELK